MRHHFIRDLIKTLQISNHMINPKLMPENLLTKNSPNKILTSCQMLIGNFNQSESNNIVSQQLPGPEKSHEQAGC